VVYRQFPLPASFHDAVVSRCFTVATIFLSAVSAEGPREPTLPSVSDTCLLVEYKGSVLNGGGNLASPVPIGDDLWFIDQTAGDIYVKRKNRPIINIFNGTCDDLRCDLKSCRKSSIYSPQYDGVHMIASASNDVLRFKSDGKFLQKAPS
jgi:hypothetical protein